MAAPQGCLKLEEVRAAGSPCQDCPDWVSRGREQRLMLPCPSVPPSGQEDLFSCCQRKNFRGAPCSFFAIHITAALVLFMTDGMMVSLPPKADMLYREASAL